MPAEPPTERPDPATPEASRQDLEAILRRGFARRTNIETIMLPRGDQSLTMAVSRRRFQSGVETWPRPLTPDTDTADAVAAVR